MHAVRALLVVVIATTVACSGASSNAEEDILVFAAASLGDVLQEIGAEFERHSGIRVVFNFAGSNVLARQIAASPVADAFISADDRWMDYVANLELVAPGSRSAPLGNRLVVVTNSDRELQLDSLAELAETEFRFLSLADPNAVPAGRYARATLRGIRMDDTDLWSRLRQRVAPAPDVRAALALVAAQHDIVGIVYRTDALTSPRVWVALDIPASMSPSIRYSVAAIGAQPTAATERWLEHLHADTTRATFERHGFLTYGSH